MSLMQYIGCDTKGGGGNFSCKLDKNTETVILQFFCHTDGILETQKLFTKAYFTPKPTYSYLHLFIWGGYD